MAGLLVHINTDKSARDTLNIMLGGDVRSARDIVEEVISRHLIALLFPNVYPLACPAVYPVFVLKIVLY